MKYVYDIVVVGAGPAGSRAAKAAAEAGASVLLIEKDRDIGLPVRCAEGVYHDEITELVELDDNWISQRISGSELVAPNGQRVQAERKIVGYILNRKVFDFDLAVMASEAGAHIWTGAFVYGMEPWQHGTFRVLVLKNGEEIEVITKFVIGADGIESRLGRWAGIDTSIALSDVEAAYQVTLANIKIDPEVVQFYVTKEFSPGGYCWVFPKSKGMANVGVGVLGKYVKRVNPEKSLKLFISHYFPKGTVISKFAGGVPVLPGLKRMVADGVILAGDAARQANPLSGGGITNGMVAGDLAAKYAVRALSKNDVSKENLKAYQKEWNKLRGKDNIRMYKLKRIIDSMEESIFNDLVEKMSGIPQAKRTPFAFFKRILFNHPKLIVDAAKMFI